jgi:hypothetical protein
MDHPPVPNTNHQNLDQVIRTWIRAELRRPDDFMMVTHLGRRAARVFVKADIGPPFKQQILTDTMLPSARPRGGAKPARLEPRVRSRRNWSERA